MRTYYRFTELHFFSIKLFMLWLSDIIRPNLFSSSASLCALIRSPDVKRPHTQATLKYTQPT